LNLCIFRSRRRIGRCEFSPAIDGAQAIGPVTISAAEITRCGPIRRQFVGGDALGIDPWRFKNFAQQFQRCLRSIRRG